MKSGGLASLKDQLDLSGCAHREDDIARCMSTPSLQEAFLLSEPQTLQRLRRLLRALCVDRSLRRTPEEDAAFSMLAWKPPAHFQNEESWQLTLCPVVLAQEEFLKNVRAQGSERFSPALLSK